MNGEDAYESWKGERSGFEPPEGFADRVMESVRASAQAPPMQAPGFFERLVSRSGAAAAVLALGFGLGALRLGLALLIVLFSS